MCGGRAHLFDLEVLNLTYYGSSAWTITKVGNLPPGGVSMALLDTFGNCERCDASNVASSRPLGTVIVEAAVANGTLAWTRLRWQFTAEEVKPLVVMPVAKPAARPAVKTVAKTAEKIEAALLELTTSGSSSATSGSNWAPGGLDLSVGIFLSLAPAKARKQGASRLTKISRRLRASLRFLADRDGAPRSKQKPAAAFTAPLFTFKAPGSASKRLCEVVEAGSASGSDELEECNAESVMDLLLMDGQDQDAFDLADCLATDLMNHERAEFEVSEQAERAKALAEEAERAKALEIMWAAG